MEELTVIGAENGALVVVGDDGTRYRVPITEALHTAIRQNRPAQPAAHRVSPREIQAQIRAGLSAAEVVAATGEALEYVQRFEGPVLAEREYVVTAARSVPVAVAADTESGVAAHTFGGVIDQRLDELGATEIAWASWKKDALWTIRVAFLDGEVSREALWSFDPKKSTLSPANHEAQSLSQQGDGPTTALPRLRAVTTDPADDQPSGRFDSGAFQIGPEAVAPATPSRVGVRTDPDDIPRPAMGQTADLLEALRRRRGEREPAPQDERDAARAAHPSTGSIRVIEVPLDRDEADMSDTADSPTLIGMDGDLPNEAAIPASSSAGSPSEPPAKPATAKRGRAAMPSWDEIVFGARPDDDPA
ncbi:DNA-binding protein [Microcella alkaliphila]|uniref:DNA-binding protein n=2 Tax=Microcella alkaliphila TaxID=279828 RepID=A0A0U5B8M6_9MICO|nr:DNA-binding protein [Microcella alkaliphila]